MVTDHWHTPEGANAGSNGTKVGHKVGNRTLQPSWLHAVTRCRFTIEVNGNMCLFSSIGNICAHVLPGVHCNMFLTCTGES